MRLSVKSFKAVDLKFEQRLTLKLPNITQQLFVESNGVKNLTFKFCKENKGEP